MDETCTFLKRVLNWANIQQRLNIVFARKASFRIISKPRPLIEFYLMDWDCNTIINMQEQNMTLLPGEVFISNAHVGYTSTTQKGWNYWCVSINVGDSPEFANISNAPIMMKSKILDFEEVSEAFNYVNREYGREGELHEIRLKTNIAKLLICLIDNINDSKNDTIHPRAIRTALDKIHIEYNNPAMSLSDLARTVHLSGDHFGRIFRECMGLSPIKYLTKKRINAACELICRNDTLSIKEIAYQVGFLDALHFSRLFHKYMGTSPRNYQINLSKKTQI
jgi:AraC-like DNA-binding protein